MEKIKFGMPTLIELSSLEETLKLCNELSLDFIELNMNLPQYQIEQLEEVERLRMSAEQHQLFYTIHLDETLNVCDFNKEVAKAYQNTVERAIQAARQLKIPVLNMHMNHGVHFTLPDRKVHLFAQYKQEYLQAMREFRSMCEKAIGPDGIKICIENTDGFLEYEKEAVELLLESKAFALTWDIGHSHAVKDIDEPFIMKHKQRLEHFHIHDALGEQNHRTLGTGEINLRNRLDLARQLGCRCVVETKTVDALRKSVEWLRKEQYGS
ncbi:MAG: sugar phosphate isomerase/epimerase family protein [bacterium]|nr:sugar phosphate isomerase/epimerase family protein [bacterium]